MLKYGLRFNPFTFVRKAVTPAGNLPLLLCWPSMLLYVLCALGIEKLALRVRGCWLTNAMCPAGCAACTRGSCPLPRPVGSSALARLLTRLAFAPTRPALLLAHAAAAR